MKKTNTKQNKKKAGQQAVGLAAPSAFGMVRTSSKPVEKVGINGSRIVEWTEYVQDIAGSVNFTASTFPVQPGLSTLFAYLSTQALSYQEYRFRKLGFIYETEKPTTAGGKVMMAFLPDAADTLPTSKQDMLENEYKLTAPAWAERVEFMVPEKALSTLGEPKYVRFGALAANLDIKTYDCGQLIIATQGMADTTLVGELYVHYQVELMTPVIDSQAFSAAFSSSLTGVSPSQTSAFGASPTVSGGLSLTVTGNTITFQRVGKYVVTYVANGTGLFTAFSPNTSTSTANSVSIFSGISNAAANAGTTAIVTEIVTVTARGQTLVLDCSGVSTTITSSFARIGTST